MKIETNNMSFAAHYRWIVRAEQEALRARQDPFGIEGMPKATTKTTVVVKLEKPFAPMQATGSINFQQI